MNLKLTKYLVFLYIFSPLFFLNVSEANPIFLINNIEITVNTDNSKNMRNNAMINAEIKALDILAKKTLTTIDYKEFQKINNIDASYLVESIEFVNEIMSEDFYLAVFNIKFNPYRTREFFQANSLTFSEIKSNQIPLYATFSNHKELYLMDNFWEEKWREKSLVHEFIDLSYNTISREIKSDLSLSKFLNLDFIQNKTDFEENNLVLIWCEPRVKGNKIELNIISKIIINNKSKIIQNSFLEEFSINDPEYLNDVIEVLVDNVYNHWIKVTSHSENLTRYSFVYNVRNLEEWFLIKQILEGIDTISSYEIHEFDTKEIKGSINFYGNLDKFRLILNQYKIHTTDLGAIQVLQLNND